MNTQTDKELLKNLYKLVFKDKELDNILSKAFESANSVFNDNSYQLPYSAKDIMIEPFRQKLPSHLQNMVNMCRVFILKKGMRFTSLENHRNSIQRLVSYKGCGSIYRNTSSNHLDLTNFVPTHLCCPNQSVNTEILEHWNIVPFNTWHFPEAGKNKDWWTVTFHSQTSENIIDDYKDFPEI